MDIIEFYNYPKAEIITIFKKFLVEDLFKRFPELNNKISVIITGSIPENRYDQYSDIDCEFFFKHEHERKKMNDLLRSYKKNLKKRGLPIQFHPAKTYTELKHEHIAGWEHDDSLKEYSRALIIFDPYNRFRNIQESIQWYPKKVLQEKIYWLFAEAIFHFEEQFKIAQVRSNALYAASESFRVAELLANALLLSNKQYSVFAKHLRAALLDAGEKTFVTYFQNLADEKNIEQKQKILKKMTQYTEKRLIKNQWINKQTTQYWIACRPKYRVEHCL